MRSRYPQFAVFAALLACWSGNSVAMELTPTPIQDAFRAQMLASTTNLTALTSDEFGSAQKAPTITRPESRHKSTVVAALLSAAVPGGGEYYLGHRRKARFFFGAEAATWTAFISFRTYGGWKKDDFIRFARTNANARLDGKSDEFLDLVGFYSDIDDYNGFGRVYDPQRPYLPDTPENHWRWQSSHDQEIYRQLKNRSREAYRRADFMIGVAVASRIVSIIDAIWTSRQHRNQLDNGFSELRQSPVRIRLNPLASTRQLTLTLYPSF